MKKMLLLLTFSAATTALAGDVVKRGAAISPDAKRVAVAKVLENPAGYSKSPVVVEDVIEKNCTNKGCWMVLGGMRVTFKDYGFFVPLDSKGMLARAEGVTSVKVLSKQDVDHLESEGAKFKRNADGTANEVSFVASGVELRSR